MSSAQYQNFQIEESSKDASVQESKRFVVVTGRAKSADPVAEALDLVLANGSMPV
jgi:hypothetical protein